MSCSVVDRRSAVGRSTGACRLQGGSSGSLAVKSPPGSGPNAGLGAAVTTGRNPAQFRPNKPCCFCWCCCCSCSWNKCLVKGVEDNGPTKNPNNTDLFNCDGEPTPTLEEIRNWGKSFDKLMKSTAGRKVFRDFLRCEYSEENILFWLACEELKRESNPDAVEERARFIYEDYISILSPKEVSLDSRVREIVNRNMVEPTPHTFDEAQLQIYTLMHRDSYPRFVNSPLYKTLAQLNNDEDAVEQQRTEQTPPPQQHASPQLTVVTPTTPQTTAPQLASPQLVCKVSEASPPPHEATTGAVPSSVTEQTSLPTSCTPMPSPIAVPSLSVANQTSEQTQCDSGNIG